MVTVCNPQQKENDNYKRPRRWIWKIVLRNGKFVKSKIVFFTPKLQVMHLILMAVNNKSHIRLKLLHSYQIKT